MSVVKYRESHYVRVLVLYAKDLIFEIWNLEFGIWNLDDSLDLRTVTLDHRRKDGLHFIFKC